MSEKKTVSVKEKAPKNGLTSIRSVLMLKTNKAGVGISVGIIILTLIISIVWWKKKKNL